MIKTFTRNDVIRFVYDEVSAEERSDMELLMMSEESFMKLYHKYNVVKNQIRKVAIEPSENVIDRILMYSKSFSLQQ
ncbi:MAG: hypothetical protein H7259_09690 [Cytophagales bacterium]|nr:hypothetical protein [Cytophaga sp.]